MQGINQSKHQHLVDALLQLENLLYMDSKANADLQQAAELRQQLETMRRDYNRQIAELAELIADYQQLFNKAKMQFLSPKLKALRKQVPHDKTVFQLLVENIQVVYRT